MGTKRDADNVHQTLTNNGYSCSLLHGQVDNAERDTTMEAFRNGESNVLITTNLLARGVDVDNVCLVVNYDVPVDKNGNPDFETYLHRIGRTGRFGRKGTALNLISDQRAIGVLAAIEADASATEAATDAVQILGENLAGEAVVLTEDRSDELVERIASDFSHASH